MSYASPTLTDYGRTLLLNVLFGLAASPPGQLYMGLSRTTPSIDGSNFTELSGLNYSRVAMPTWSAPVTGVPAVPGGTGSITYTNPTADITFPNPSGNWNTIPDGLHAGLFDASVGGNLIWLLPGIITTLQHPTHDHPLHIAAFDGGGNPQVWVGTVGADRTTSGSPIYSSLDYQKDAGSYPSNFNLYTLPDSYRKGLLDRMTGRSAAWTPPTYYIGFYNNRKGVEPNQIGFFDSLWSMPTPPFTRDTYPGDPAYSRSAVSWGSVTQVFGKSSIAPSSTFSWTIGITSPNNPNPGTFADWAPWVDQYNISLWDAASGGNQIIQTPILNIFGILTGDITVGDVFRIPAGNVKFSVF